jgi:hypothetical protein
MDLHEDIHRAIENYLEPNEFRRWLNSAIQTSRGVTFLLQKRKARWADFDDWYGKWQEIAKVNPVLSWGVTSRNRIVKEEDLTTLSSARVTYYGERIREAEDVFLVPPEFDVDAILAIFARASKGKKARKSGMVRVQRRWVDDRLPEYELVSALREMYRSVGSVVRSAHGASGTPSCAIQSFARPCITAKIDPDLHCLPPGDTLTTKSFDLATGKVFSSEFVEMKRDDDIAKVGLARYGAPPIFTSDPIEHTAQRLILSKQYLEVDGYSGPSLMFFNSTEAEMRSIATIFEDGVPRELKIQGAVDGCGAWQFDGAVFSSEMWIGTSTGRGTFLDVDPSELQESNTEFFNPDPVGNRDEALIVVGLSADGRSRVMTLPFGRTETGIVYGDVIDEVDGGSIPRFLSPIWRNWPERK